MTIKTYLFNHDEYPKAKTPKTLTKRQTPHHQTTQHSEGEHTKNQTDATPGRNKNVAATAAIYAKQGPDNSKKKKIADGQQARPTTTT
ncbi:hypothetical protein MTR_0019s0320 [Medicago truncatula]|uniref:Uncharacterized protein n=1 Tax=Medicago truncatula TaxID=3880 RepID=A0A072TJS4_MEDTR|nr:hypothetical protein MTR_0019s0320 [Medicago truncatula]